MGIVTAFILAIVAVIGGAISQILSDEFRAWTPWIVNFLIRLAVCRLPKDLHERFYEEWHAHIDEIPGNVGKILLAVEFALASLQMGSAADIVRKSMEQSKFTIAIWLVAAAFVGLSIVSRTRSKLWHAWNRVRGLPEPETPKRTDKDIALIIFMILVYHAAVQTKATHQST